MPGYGAGAGNAYQIDARADAALKAREDALLAREQQLETVRLQLEAAVRPQGGQAGFGKSSNDAWATGKGQDARLWGDNYGDKGSDKGGEKGWCKADSGWWNGKGDDWSDNAKATGSWMEKGSSWQGGY